MDIANATTTALSVKGSSALAIVLAGIATSNRLQEEYEATARAGAKTVCFPAHYYERHSAVQMDTYFALMDAMPYLPADGLAEAAAQIGHAMNVVNQTYDQIQEDSAADRPFKDMERKVSLLLYSAIRAIEKAGGFTLTSMGLSNLASPYLDPWADVEGVVTKIKSDGVK